MYDFEEIKKIARSMDFAGFEIFIRNLKNYRDETQKAASAYYFLHTIYKTAPEIVEVGDFDDLAFKCGDVVVSLEAVQEYFGDKDEIAILFDVFVNNIKPSEI